MYLAESIDVYLGATVNNMANDSPNMDEIKKLVDLLIT